MANSLSWMSPPFYAATLFDRVTGINRGGNLGTIANSQLGLFSFWLKMNPLSDDAAEYSIIQYSTGPSALVQISRNPSSVGSIFISCLNSSAVEIINFASNNNLFLATSGWNHVMITYDLGNAANKDFFVNGVSQLGTVLRFTNGANDATHQVDYKEASGYDWYISTQLTTPIKYLWGSLCEFYFQVPATYFTDTTKFRSAAGHPISLGSDGSTPTGVQPFIYLRNYYDTWTTNLGSGGNFTTAAGALQYDPNIP